MQINLISFITFIIGLFVGFLASYMKEKGKNLATKEDVSEITDKIEGTKIQYIKNIEELKADLQLYIGQQSKREVVYKEVSLTIFEIVNSFHDVALYIGLEYDTGMNLGAQQMSRELDSILSKKFNKLKNIAFENSLYIESDLLNEIINTVQDFAKNSVYYNSIVDHENRITLRTDLNQNYFKENILPVLKDIVNRIRANIEVEEYNGEFFENITFYDL